ncbi:hypothetical protein CDD83_3092 [Cordyceps sp. RAO-2017]|nr:hypothetical protein CDD83_3092 [Cordyceps sp. RAO-2017]
MLLSTVPKLLGLAALAGFAQAQDPKGPDHVWLELQKKTHLIPGPPADPNYKDKSATSSTGVFRNSTFQWYPLDKSAVAASSWAAVWGSNQEGLFREQSVFPSPSLGHALMESWARHEDIIISPDTVWREILAQLSLYIYQEPGWIYKFIRPLTTDVIAVPDSWLGDFAGKMTAHLAESRYLNAQVADWVKPGFSTSTADDELTAAAVLLGRPQSLRMRTNHWTCLGEPLLRGTVESPSCGSPSISLLGTRADWVKLAEKVEKLTTWGWGWQAVEYADGLRPVLERMVDTFDQPAPEELQDFWTQMIVRKRPDCYGGADAIAGWINAFYYWGPSGRIGNMNADGGVTVGGNKYSPRSIYDIPVSYSAMDLKLIDKEEDEREWNLVAGNIGMRRDQTENKYVGAEQLGGWFVYGPRNGIDNPDHEGHVKRISNYLGSC